MEDYPFYAGIDVSKDELEVAVLDGQPGRRISFSCSNDKKGMTLLRKTLRRRGHGLVLLEATGGLHRLAARTLEEAGQRVCVLNPRQVNQLARGLGQLAKTDRIDARMLAEIADRLRPEPRPQRSREEEALADLVARDGQLTRMITAEKNRLSSAPRATRGSIEKHLRYLEKDRRELRQRIARTISSSGLGEKERLLKSTPGVGAVVAATLLGSLPELGRLRKGAVGNLVGVVPLNNDSGKYSGQRRCWGGRSDVRAALYMAALVATRYNPLIRRFYQHLLAKGKAPKVALNACMHKLLTILNAMLRDGRTFQERSSIS